METKTPDEKKDTKTILSLLRIEEKNIDSSVRLIAPPKVRKSLSTEYFRTYSEFSFLTRGLANVPGHGFLFVAPSASEGIEDDLKPIKLHLCQSRDGEFFFYPRILSGKNGMGNSWTESAENALQEATKRWIRIKAGGGAYEYTAAASDLGEPDWSSVVGKEDELLEAALKTCFISSSDHIVLRKLRGEL